jgi:hypothetical protein
MLLLAIWAAAGADVPNTASVYFLYTSAKQYDADAWMHGGERFPQGARIFVHDSNGEHSLVPAFADSTDPAVSFDGRRVLFSGKRNQQDPWEIWEFSFDDQDVHRVVACAEGCIRPLYLPEDRVVYAHRLQGRFVIEAISFGPTEPLRLTYSPGNALPQDVLRDGRILFGAAYPLGGSAVTELYAVYSDGSGVEAYRCDHGANRSSGRQVSSGDIVLVSGQQLARFSSPLAHEMKIAAPAGDYAGDVAELPDGAWLLPWRPDSRRPYALVRWAPGSNKLSPVQQKSENHALEPVLLAPRPVPNRHPSGLHAWSYANLLCLSAYTGKSKIAPSSLAMVRLYTQDALGRPKLLGEAAVEEDGSFYMRTPADQPLQIEVRDRAGKIVKKEDGWFWLRRGEQRICVGCHAGPETSPENAVPRALLRSTIPADLTGKTVQSASGGH